MQVTELTQDIDGILVPGDFHNVDFTADNGVIAPCAGSTSPWNTHLGGEEWGVPDGRAWADDGIGKDGGSLRYHGLAEPNGTLSLSLDETKQRWSPYMHRYVNEVAIDDSEGSPVITAVKHYSMGRYSIELPFCGIETSPQVCYITDDASNGVPCAYMPDVRNDLTAGELKCAKIQMTSEPNEDAGEYSVEWIALGHATDSEIKAIALSKPDGDHYFGFYDMFETATFDGSAPLGSYCPAGFTAVNAGGGEECLKVKVGMEKAASRLETRRYAAMLGATTEWTKMEGITYSKERNELYMAMSTVYKSMEDNMYYGAVEDEYDIGGFNSIRAKFNKCGCVYRMSVNSTTNLYTDIKSLICGHYKSQSNVSGSQATWVHTNNDCDIFSISNPDNVAFMEGYDKLLIGEDTGNHESNAVWSYDMLTHSLVRLLTVPVGAETTGTYFYKNINGYAYIMNQVQHADVWQGRPSAGRRRSAGGAGGAGYVGPIPVARGALPEQHVTQFYFSKLPSTVEEKQDVLTSPVIQLDGQTQSISYHEIAHTGQTRNGITFGNPLDKDGNPVMASATEIFLTSMEDFTSLLHSEKDPYKLYAVTHLEDKPGAMQVTELTQDIDGILVPGDFHNVDFTADNGVIAPCAGSTSPWNTHLGGEEWGVPDGRAWADDGIGKDGGSLRYHGLAEPNGTLSLSLDETKQRWSPYMHRYVNEVAIDDSEGSPVITAVKHYSMGRYSIELPFCGIETSPQVCYITDDASNGVPCAYMPDVRNDLTAGELKCAKIQMTSEPNEDAGEYSVEWIALGHATDSEIKAIALSKPDGDHYFGFYDMFETATFDGSAPLGSYCPAGFTAVNAGGGEECLKVKVGMEKAASRLETRRYAAMLGATTEWTKMEGITYSKERKELYMAMSTVYKSMEDNMYYGAVEDKYDIGGFNSIRAKFNKCGCVYRMPVDSTTNLYKEIKSLICGQYKSENGGAATWIHESNGCNVLSISNPDNVAFMEGYDKLLIGEDTGEHDSNAVWSYDMVTHSLTRILTVPVGAETTGTYFYNNINGYAYIMNQVQHADVWQGRPSSGRRRSAGGAGGVGYVGPIKIDVHAGTACAVNTMAAGRVSCRDIKEYYRSQSCCGLPSKRVPSPMWL